MAETTPHGYVATTLGTLQKLKLDTLIATRRSRQHNFAAAVKVFDGNTANPNTLSTVVQRANRSFGLQQIVVAGDRGMLTEVRINEDLNLASLDWISALNTSAIRKLVAHDALDTTLCDERDMAQIACEELYPGERLMVCRNPLLFQDEWKAESDSVVAKAERSERSQSNAASKRTEYALPVNSFKGFMKHLRRCQRRV